ncbi:MAG: hypothetical protein S4CHLAM20_05930 [Chlamydiia bacterium]|nr:hypothetical protein [Chlamydiia bacterium]
MELTQSNFNNNLTAQRVGDFFLQPWSARLVPDEERYAGVLRAITTIASIIITGGLALFFFAGKAIFDAAHRSIENAGSRVSHGIVEEGTDSAFRFSDDTHETVTPRLLQDTTIQSLERKNDDELSINTNNSSNRPIDINNLTGADALGIVNLMEQAGNDLYTCCGNLLLPSLIKKVQASFSPEKTLIEHIRNGNTLEISFDNISCWTAPIYDVETLIQSLEAIIDIHGIGGGITSTTVPNPTRPGLQKVIDAVEARIEEIQRVLHNNERMIQDFRQAANTLRYLDGISIDEIIRRLEENPYSYKPFEDYIKSTNTSINLNKAFTARYLRATPQEKASVLTVLSIILSNCPDIEETIDGPIADWLAQWLDQQKKELKSSTDNAF